MSGARDLRAASWTLALTGFAIVLAWLPLGGVLQFDRASAASEPWRLLTCHFTHWDRGHSFWDVLMFAVLSCALEHRSRAGYLLCVVMSALVISAVLVAHGPGMAVYRGLSGIDSALFTFLAGTLLRDGVAERRWGLAGGFALVIVGFVAKVVWEMATGHTLLVDPRSFTPVAVVHVAGAVVGGIMVVLPVAGRGKPLQVAQSAH